MRGRGYRARSVADGRQQLDRRESDAIIAGQLAFAVIIGVGWVEVGGDQGAGGTQGVPRTAGCTRAQPASYALTYT